MVVIGIDFGSESCVVSVFINDRLEIVTNDFFQRKTPSLVAFTENAREIGTLAFNQQVNRDRFTFAALKYNLRRSVLYIDDYWELKHKNRRSSSQKAQLRSFTCLCNVAALFSKLKEFADVFVNPVKVSGCIIAYPSDFNYLELHALIIAAGIAGLNCRQLIKETTAVAVNYCFFRMIQQPINVVFVDIGHSSTQVSSWEFSATQAKIFGEAYDLVGGQNLDTLIAEHFIDTYGRSDFKADPVIYLGLLREVEKLKRNVGLDTEATVRHDIGYLLNEDSLVLSLNQHLMEKICAPVFERIRNFLQSFIMESNIKLDDIHSVEVVGGSCSISKVKTIIQDVFQRPVRVTMNQDEAVAKGCALITKISHLKRYFRIIDKLHRPRPRRNVYISGLNIKQIHKNYQGRDEVLPITRQLMDYFVRSEKFYQQREKHEDVRHEARNELDEYCREIRKKIGKTLHLNDEFKKELPITLSQLKFWHDGTSEEYLKKLEDIKFLIEDNTIEEKGETSSSSNSMVNQTKEGSPP